MRGFHSKFNYYLLNLARKIAQLYNRYHAFILFYTALKIYMHKIVLPAFRKTKNLGLNLHLKTPA